MKHDGPIVFVGPSLTLDHARALLPDALFLPPIRRGELKPFHDNPPSVVGIIDGVFYQHLAISPKEILPLLQLGTKVFGASSIGALRAVELSAYGMVGVGQIFNFYRRRQVTADDEVATTVCPESLRPLSEPLVNIRIALKAAKREGILSDREAAYILRSFKTLYFPERKLHGLFACAGRILPPNRLASFRSWWSASAPNAKEEDARELLLRIAAL